MFVQGIKSFQRRVATLHAAVELEPLAVHIAQRGILGEDFQAMDVACVTHAATALVSVVGADFTVAPVGHRDIPHRVGLSGRSTEAGVCGINQQVGSLGGSHRTVVQGSLRHDIEETALVAAGCEGCESKCEGNVFQFHNDSYIIRRLDD